MSSSTLESRHDRFAALIPVPVEVVPRAGEEFRLDSDVRVHVSPGAPAARRIGDWLAASLRPATGYAFPVSNENDSTGISLLLEDCDERVGEEGYLLEVTEAGVTIRARAAGGLFNGAQTLRQLLPAEIDSPDIHRRAWTIPAGRVLDYPRYAVRGVMLDVARHFFTLGQVKKFIDQVAAYKINRLHLHLTDDQGWRVDIPSWPRLATHGGSTSVGGGGGGFFTLDQYDELVAYAADRNMTVVPEIDLPGHTNAALAAYPELTEDGVAPDLYTGIEVGFSSLVAGKDLTYRFVEEVLGEIAAHTPGDCLHIGGDEAKSTSGEDYRTFIARVLAIVRSLGKKAVGWHELAVAEPGPDTVLQYWRGYGEEDDAVLRAVAAGGKVIMSPADRSYLDMKYDESTPIGLDWAGHVSLFRSYDWDPADLVTGIGADAVLGVEAPLWTETMTNSDEIEFMTFPRLPAIAEIGWSPRSTHDWVSFQRRLRTHAERWDRGGLNHHRSALETDETK